MPGTEVPRLQVPGFGPPARGSAASAVAGPRSGYPPELQATPLAQWGQPPTWQSDEQDQHSASTHTDQRQRAARPRETSLHQSPAQQPTLAEPQPAPGRPADQQWADQPSVPKHSADHRSTPHVPGTEPAWPTPQPPPTTPPHHWAPPQPKHAPESHPYTQPAVPTEQPAAVWQPEELKHTPTQSQQAAHPQETTPPQWPTQPAPPGKSQPASGLPTRPAGPPPAMPQQPNAAPPTGTGRPLPPLGNPLDIYTTYSPEDLLRALPHGEPTLRRVKQRLQAMLGTSVSHDVETATQLAEKLRQPVTTCRRIAVLSMRGGAGKTTVAALVAIALAQSRVDKVLALDADPLLGSLALRVGTTSPTSIAQLGRTAPVFADFSEAEPHLGRTEHGLWVATGSKKAETDPLDGDSYRAALSALTRFFAVAIIDCGVGTTSPVNAAVLTDAHAIALVTPATVDGVLSAHRALKSLRNSQSAHLLARIMVVLTSASPQTPKLDVSAVTRHGVPLVRIPHDRHLAAGTVIHPRLLAAATRETVLRITANLLELATRSPRGTP
ncbi:hypothetical protein C3Y87_20780 [Carbonactinospora thermoautotrophica]|nr:hypothetical protein [Carbonactinospora thermoautotrophica]